MSNCKFQARRYDKLMIMFKSGKELVLMQIGNKRKFVDFYID